MLALDSHTGAQSALAKNDRTYIRDSSHLLRLQVNQELRINILIRRKWIEEGHVINF
jgi:hypothetical protein